MLEALGEGPTRRVGRYGWRGKVGRDITLKVIIIFHLTFKGSNLELALEVVGRNGCGFGRGARHLGVDWSVIGLSNQAGRRGHGRDFRMLHFGFVVRLAESAEVKLFVLHVTVQK